MEHSMRFEFTRVALLVESTNKPTWVSSSQTPTSKQRLILFMILNPTASCGPSYGVQGSAELSFIVITPSSSLLMSFIALFIVKIHVCK